MKNGLTRLVLAFAVFGLLVSPVAALELSNYELLERITALENQLTEAPAVSQDESMLASWANRISLSGLIEVEAFHEDVDSSDPELEDNSDITLATVELGVDVAIANHVSGSVLLLFEEGEGSIDVDEAFILYDGEEDLPLFVRGGKFYVPFGNYSTNMISDPLTLEVGETNESAVELGFNSAGFYGSVYAFAGDIDEAGKESHIDNFGVNMGYAIDNDNFSLDIGVSYINNILDSDGLGDDFEEQVADAEDAGDVLELDDYVAGFGAHVVMCGAGFTVIGEYIAALDDPEYVRNGVKEKADALSVWNIELGYTFDVVGKETTVGVAYQGSDDAGDFIAESRYMGLVSVGIFEGTSLAVEYFRDEFENNDKANVITAQLAIEF